jgi:drug/metabolite transporter (DMT)-like permease
MSAGDNIDRARGTMPPAKASILLAFAALYLIWGSTYLGIRVAIETMPPFLMAGIRFAVAGILLFGYLIARGAPWPTATQWRYQFIAGLFLLLGGNAVVSWAELRTPSGITCLILGASPLFLVLLDWGRPGGKRPTAVLATGVAVGLIGVAILVGPGAIPEDARPPLIDVLALILASLSWWIGSLYIKHTKSGTSLVMASAMQMLSASASMLLVGWILGEGRGFHFGDISTRSWAALAYLVAAGSLVAFPVYVWLLEHSTPAKVSTYAYVNPVVALALGWAILGEPMNLRMAFATVIIIGAVAIITIGKARGTQNS